MEKLSKEISTELTLSDMRVINNIIEFAAAKGIIRPNDYTIIGSIYEKISQLVNNESKPSS
jgi:hypothetical protein